MVNIKMDGKSCVCEVAGNRREIVVDLEIAIGSIYNRLKETAGEKEAMLFQLDLFRCLGPSSPTWKPRNGQVTINKK